jgi:hypothetical protein
VTIVTSPIFLPYYLCAVILKVHVGYKRIIDCRDELKLMESVDIKRPVKSAKYFVLKKVIKNKNRIVSWQQTKDL